MKVLACTICGRNVLVGNATKTVVCAICNSSLAAKIKKEQKEREKERRSCANPDCYNTFVPSVPLATLLLSCVQKCGATV